jgi:2-polyprenyl-6-methoxyphenol hydroxylase-like FAD-dependent oxidoreductase
MLIQPSGQAVLARLGLLDNVRAHAAVVNSLQGYTGRWRTLDLHYRHGHPDWHGLGIHRASLHQVLWQAAKDCGATFHLGTPVTGFESQPDGVGVHLPQGAQRFDALIIANGTRSLLREKLAVTHYHQPYPWGAYWAVLERDDWPFPDILMQRYRGAHVMLGILPTGRNPLTQRRCYSLFWSLPRTAFAQLQQDGIGALVQSIRPIWPEVADWLAGAPETHVAIAEYADVRLRPWHHERVLVIGDAAHAMSPQLGQGANMALIDAWVLSQSLAQSLSQSLAKSLTQASSQSSAPSSQQGYAASPIAQALQNYSARRAAHIAYYQMTSRIMTPLYQSRYPVGWMRDIGTVIGRHVPPVYRQYLLTLCGAKQGTFDFSADIDKLLE